MSWCPIIGSSCILRPNTSSEALFQCCTVLHASPPMPPFSSPSVGRKAHAKTLPFPRPSCRCPFTFTSDEQLSRVCQCRFELFFRHLGERLPWEDWVLEMLRSAKVGGSCSGIERLDSSFSRSFSIMPLSILLHLNEEALPASSARILISAAFRSASRSRGFLDSVRSARQCTSSRLPLFPSGCLNRDSLA